MINLSAKVKRIIVWVLDGVFLLGISGQEVFGYTLPDLSGYIGILVAVLATVFGIFWQPKQQ